MIFKNYEKMPRILQLWALTYTVRPTFYISYTDIYEVRPTNYENKYTTIECTHMECRYFGQSIVLVCPQTFCFVGVLVCRRFGLWTFWFVDVLVCRRFGLSTFRFVAVSACRRFGLSTFWSVDVLGCLRFGLSTFRFVDVSVCRRFGCRRFGLSMFWPVTKQIITYPRRRQTVDLCF